MTLGSVGDCTSHVSEGRAGQGRNKVDGEVHGIVFATCVKTCQLCVLLHVHTVTTARRCGRVRP